ncbi:unnamed protein product [Auanema sp. JU1783]|nr:unnamed protein product [Auanema sp. JU1783]
MDQHKKQAEPESPPPSPCIPISGIQTPNACICSSLPISNSLNANTLADSLGVSPLYKQQDSARWNAAAQVYRSSRAVSPTQDTPFVFPEGEQLAVNVVSFINNPSKTPLSLEDIAQSNRKRHDEEGSAVGGDIGEPLELEAISAVHELAHEVQDISVSEMLPRTSDLIFVNIKTQEGQPFTLELTMKGWRIASSHTDCMYGDYTKVELHTHYYKNARELLNIVSPDHATRFNECVAKKLELLVDKATLSDKQDGTH